MEILAKEKLATEILAKENLAKEKLAMENLAKEKLAKENMAIEKWGQILLRNSQVCQVSALISYIVVYDINGFRFSFDIDLI